MIKIPKIKQTDEKGFFVSLGKNEFGGYAPDTDEVAFKAINDEYEVTLNEKVCEVRDCRVSAHPFNRPWPGKQRPFSQTESAGYISCSADEPVKLRVKAQKSFSSAVLRPLSKNITPKVIDGELEFTLTEQGSYVLELDGSHRALHIFFNEIKEYPDAKRATHYFGAGMHFPGNINLRDGDSVYIDPEAIVFGSLCSTGAKNVRVFGGGVIDGCFEERITENCYENHTKGNIRLYNCENVDISDVILTNSATWCLSLFNCKGVTVDGVKIVGQWRYNTDGIDVVNSSDVNIKNCFIRSFDDTVTVKGIYDFDGVIENIAVENCVLWCGWGNTCEIGIETAAREYRNITFKNCDVIHTSGPAMSVLGGNQADIHGILYKNINVEFSSDQEPPIVQTAESQSYDAGQKRAVTELLRVDNKQYSIRKKIPDSVVRANSEKLGTVKGVRFENIKVLTDSEDIKPRIKIVCMGDKKNVSDISVREIYLNGELQRDGTRFDRVFDNFEEEIWN